MPSNALAAPASPGVPTQFSVPFRGVLKAREQRDLLLNSAEITYTIGDRRIRRETARTAPLGRLADWSQGAAGIICDLQTERVVLYRSEPTKKRFVRMTLAEYRKLVAEAAASPGTAERALFSPAVRPAFWKHVGTFFADVPQPIPGGHVVNVPESRTVGGLTCDQLTIQLGDTVFEVCHCRRVQADRQLLELVEWRLPQEVQGFPCLMRRLQLVPVAPAEPSESKGRQLLQKGAHWAARAAEKAMKREVELLQIAEQIPPDSAFALDDTFVECPTLDELRRQFQPAQGHHDDWD